MRITTSYYNEVFVEWVIVRKIMLTHHKETPVINFLAQFFSFPAAANSAKASASAANQF